MFPRSFGLAVLAVIGMVAGTATAQSTLPRFQEIHRDIKAFSKRAREAQTPQERTDAIVDLSSLYVQIVSDPRFARSERLQSYRGRIAAQLREQEKRLRKELAQNERGADSRFQVDGTVRTGNASEQPEPVPFFAIVDDHMHLASHVGGGAGPTLYFASGAYGTSGYYSGRFGGFADDNADELIELIQTVLHPDFWQVNGGPGALFYYRPSLILVVRATTTVHEDLTTLLERLR